MTKNRTPSSYSLSKAILALYPRIRPDTALRLLCEHVLHRLVGWPIDVARDEYVATAHLVAHYESDLRAHPPFTDLLGVIYMDLGSHYSRAAMAQYFTPKPVADLMAGLNCPSELPGDRLLRVLEPSAGSGVMLLAMLERIVELHGIEALRRVSVTGIDLDQLCCRMAAVQILASMSLIDAPIGELHILHGNSLGPLDQLVTLIHCSSPVDGDDEPQRPALAAAVEDTCA